ncbi:glucomannan 4-beta-mannosyltransferase 1-like isoform X2 [Magnolia sinica]|uniref:glucomannan 4-beta-mannosyltransferase 1-like isoform X2 n=1 Tax=Magnolia sinica TaxID=86752 RepID=UPI002659F4BF|nr:glucomannan 4-beta-mannosyltransferase 1-like isoform X2 [Magnolia sinica]
MSWPSNKLIIQVLDDSTNPEIGDKVEFECEKWLEKGVHIKYERRENRNGYKAGALREGLEKQYVKDCEFVAIFDADFQPEPDYLWRTIPFLLHNPDLALVQARWKFVNANECLMTRLQEMSLDYHFSLEQEVGSSTYSFFGFNGTAGVGRIRAVMDAGGWKDRTTVEDMDLAVRASLKGWKFVFVGDLSKVSFWKKFHVLYAFFFVRKIVAHWVTFFFYCIIIPACVLIQEVQLPKYIAIYIPSVITILNSICTPRSIHLLVFWILFENVMSLHRTKAAIIGLLEADRVNELVVTEKLGNTLKNRSNASTSTVASTSTRTSDSVSTSTSARMRPQRRPRLKFIERIHVMELIMGVFLLYCAIYDVFLGRDYFYLFLQSAAFFVMGFGYIGTFVPSN